MHPSQLHIQDFTYHLPDERIARYPLNERDASKLLVWKQGEMYDAHYRDIADYIPGAPLLVFNQTKVVQARLLFKKNTGSMLEVFCLEPHEQYPDIQTAMLQQHKVWWKCLIGGASKWKHGMVPKLHHTDFVLKAAIVAREAGSFTIEFTWDAPIAFAEVLQLAGKVPLPPYLHREAEDSDTSRYQTLYAKEEGSVAAPTAGLHFTPHIMGTLEQKCIPTGFVTLHVGAGTFRPVKAELMSDHDMHAEWIEVEVEALQHIIQHLPDGIVAVGTTSLRTLESLYWIGAQLLQHKTPGSGIAVTQWLPYELHTDASSEQALQAIVDWLLMQGQQKLVTRTQLLIAPGYTFKIVKGLITNFHQPQSTLLLLVAALTGEAWKNIYRHALDNDYRFLSYGDGCLLLP